MNSLARGLENSMPSFVFITDMHLSKNALISPGLVGRVARATDIGMVVFGGDAFDYCANKREAIMALRYVSHAFDPLEFHFVRGNHDSNMQSKKAKRRNRITDAEFVRETASDGEVREGDNLYYYRDDARCKVRYLFLDSNAPNSAYMGKRQLSWVKQRVLELDEGWTVLVFVHQFFCVKRKNGVVVRCVYDKNGIMIRDLLDSIYDDAAAEARMAQRDYLKIHPRDQEENKLLLLKAERMYEEALGDLRPMINRSLMEFEAILNRQKPEEITQGREDFRQALSQLEELMEDQLRDDFFGSEDDEW